jgi:glycosyltransferase involved in cell wall biosynthesis
VKVGVFIGDATPDSGGGFTFVHEILERLAEAKTSHRFTVLTHKSVGDRTSGGLDVLSLEPVLPDLVGRGRRKLRRSVDRALGRAASPYLGAETRLERLLTQAGLDVIWHVQPAAFWTQDIPYITIVWDLQHRLQPFFPEVSSAGEFGYRDNIYQPLLQRASLVIAGTERGSEEIQRFYGVAPERIRILPHPTPGFALGAAAEPTRPRPSVAPGDPYLFYPAQFWPHKNHVNLLEALRLLRTRDGFPVSLVLSGSDKGNGEYVQRVARDLGVADFVKNLGFVSRDDLVGLYQHAFALTYVTYFGPENLPTLEAFALGCPVVASDVPGAREQLGNAALLVDPSKPEEIARAVRQLRDDPALRASLVDRGRARARRFTGRDFVSGVLAWLDEFEPIRRNWPSGVSKAP